MFTGIIMTTGSVHSSRSETHGLVLEIDCTGLQQVPDIGDSIAVNGACLTVIENQNKVCRFDISHETLDKTTIGSWQPGLVVNLEPALRLGDQLGGHMVSGHVDGLGRLEHIADQGDAALIRFTLPADGSVRVIEKGSVAIDGISLTCFNCDHSQFEVAVIPHTLAVTNLGTMRPGQAVHMEQDMIGRWVASMMPQQDQ